VWSTAVLATAALLLPLVATPAAANPVLTVSSAADSGPHTLRNALSAANATPGPDRIEFDLPGSAPHVIKPVSSLPSISETLTIDGTSQPGFTTATHAPVVVLDGSSGDASSFNALFISGAAAGGSVIRGLEIVRWPGSAIAIFNTPDVVVAGNYIGTDGVADLGNGSGFMSVDGGIAAFDESRNFRIGGKSPADRNVISGNRSSQIYLASTVGSLVQGNYVGTNAAGTAAVDAGGADGVRAETNGGIIIGGTAPGAGNLVSGNRGGLVLAGTSFTVVGNRVGTNAAGTAAIPNGAGIAAGGADTTIGGTTAAARNLISGNGTGIALQGSGIVVEGNRIGTNAAGTTAIANDVGVDIGTCCNSTNDNRIGGSAAGAGNVISGNRIGLRIAPGSGNPSQTGSDNVIQGNRIGTRADGTTALPNTEGAVLIQPQTGASALGNRVGGLVPGAGNIIAFNGGPGVEIGGDAATAQTSVRANSIHDNDGLGIDLEPGGLRGVTPNDDDDPDTGPNGLQNFPGISSATSGAGGTTVAGTLESTPSQSFVLDFYASDAKDPTGSGEGAVYLGDASVTTDGGGGALFGMTFPSVKGNFVTATATSGAGDTSEFSVAHRIVGPGGFRLSSPAYSVGESGRQATVTVKRVGGSEGAVTVRFATSNGSAKAPSDYHAITRTLRFVDGQAVRTVDVPIVNDARREPAESFTVRLSNPGGGAALGTPVTAKVTIRASD
jgi:hypothetical protein